MVGVVKTIAGGIGALVTGGGGAAAPKLPPVIQPSALTAPNVTAALQAQQAAYAQAAGRGSTILTSGLGVRGEPETAKKVLLGEGTPGFKTTMGG